MWFSKKKNVNYDQNHLILTCFASTRPSVLCGDKLAKNGSQKTGMVHGSPLWPQQFNLGPTWLRNGLMLKCPKIVPPEMALNSDCRQLFNLNMDNCKLANMRYKYNDVEVQLQRENLYMRILSANMICLTIKKFEWKPKVQIYEIQNYHSQKDKKMHLENLDCWVHIL